MQPLVQIPHTNASHFRRSGIVREHGILESKSARRSNESPRSLMLRSFFRGIVRDSHRLLVYTIWWKSRRVDAAL